MRGALQSTELPGDAATAPAQAKRPVVTCRYALRRAQLTVNAETASAMEPSHCVTAFARAIHNVRTGSIVTLEWSLPRMVRNNPDTVSTWTQHLDERSGHAAAFTANATSLLDRSSTAAIGCDSGDVAERSLGSHDTSVITRPRRRALLAIRTAEIR